MIKIALEPEEYREMPMEHCVFCSKPSRYWTFDGMICVCFDCSKKHDESELPTREQFLNMNYPIK